MRLKIFILLFILLTGFVAYRVFIGEKPLANLPMMQNEKAITLNTLSQQANYLQKAFLRKRSLGFDPQSITFTEEPTFGLLADPVLVFKNVLREGWHLGKGQFIGGVDIDANDIAFYFLDADPKECPTMLKVPLASMKDWHQAFQLNRAMFGIKEEMPVRGCFETEDNKNIFYQLVFATK